MKLILKKCTIFANLMVISTFASLPPESPFSPNPAPIFGQIRVRSEFDGKNLADISSNKNLLNTRIGFTAIPSEKIGLKIELQDSRFMGSEPMLNPLIPSTSTIGNSKGVDLLQGFAAVTEGNFAAAIGRQKLTLGSGRFLSTLEWAANSRAFDGISINYNQEKFNFTGITYLVSDISEKSVEDRELLTGLFYNQKLVPTLQCDVFGFYDQSRLSATSAELSTKNYDLVYLGERLFGKSGIFTFEEEFIWQGGEFRSVGDLKSNAFQLATRAGIILGNHKTNIGVDMMSGDKDALDNTVTNYRASYYFAHAYYGWMDYFVVNPKYGVIDIRLDGDFGFYPGPTGSSRLFLKPQYHYLLPQNAPSDAADPYGQEIEIEMHLSVYAKTNFVFGAGIFFPGDGILSVPAMGVKPNQDSKPGIFLYFTPTFNF
jgi:hypothetical protein